MAENENVVVEEVPVEEVAAEKPLVEEPVTEPAPVNEGPTKGQKFLAAVKEWCRKRVVGLKRKPQTIALLFLAVTTIFFMLALYTVSQAVSKCANQPQTTATGICVFVTTLLSLLVLVSFLNAFPKRKKPSIFFIVLVFVMIAAMFACDIVYYLQITDLLGALAPTDEMYQSASAGQPFMLAHMILLGISALVFALLPVYKKLINKINTKVVLESATENMQGGIDIQED